nr:lachesin-like isoform X2 [Dermatophagoides farinae]
MHDTVISKNGRISVRSHANTTFYLTIHDVQEMDRGFYMCQVNTKPMRIQIGHLEVNVPPSFIEEKTSSDFDITENSSATLHCSANGRPEPQILWRREDEQPIQLDSQTNDSSLTIKGQHLNLKNVSRHQMGAYLCIASNGILPTISKRIFLGVSFAPIIWTNKRMVEAIINANPTIECHIESYPRANVYWQKNNQLPPIVYSDRKYTLSMNESIISYRFIARLKISDIQKNDFDKYNCIAKNKMGSEKNFVQLLERKRPPSTRRPIKPQRPTTIIRKYQNQNQNPNQKSNSNLYENKQNHNLDKPTKTSENMIIKNVHQSQDHQDFTMNINNNRNHLHDDGNDNDDDDGNEIWEYETNYMAPELTPGMKINSSLSITNGHHQRLGSIIIITIIIILCSSLCYNHD